MPLLSRAARWAATIFMSAGLLGTSVPVLASDLADDLTPATTLNHEAGSHLNNAALTLVPQPMPAASSAFPAPRAQFASLAAAVAAQDGQADNDHLRCLASAVFYESKGEPLAGQLAVAQVILNRARSGRFAADVCGVVRQRGQFGFVRAGAIPPVDETRAAFRTAVAVARVAMQEAWERPAGDALYFNGVRAARPGGRRVAVIGGHAFYR